MRGLVLGTLRIPGVQYLPEAAHNMGMLRLLLVIQMRQFLYLVGPNQVRVLLGTGDHRLGVLWRVVLRLRAIHLDQRFQNELARDEVRSYDDG